MQSSSFKLNLTKIVSSPLISIILIIAGVFLFQELLQAKPQQKLPGKAVEIIPPQEVQLTEKHDPYPTNPPTSGWYVETDMRDGIFSNPVEDEKIVNSLLEGKVAIAYNCQYGENKKPPQIPNAQSLNNLNAANNNNTDPEKSSTDDLGASPESTQKSKKPNKPNNSSNQETKSPSNPVPQSQEEIQAIMNSIRNQNKRCGSLISFLREIVEEKGAQGIVMYPNTKIKTRVALVAWGRLDEMVLLDKQRVVDFIDTFRETTHENTE